MTIRTESQLATERRELECGWSDARGDHYRSRFLHPLEEMAVALRKTMEKFEQSVPECPRDI